MNAGLITSVLFNFLLIVLLIIILLVFVTNPNPPQRQGQVPICPANFPSQTLPPFQTQRPYILKTLSGKYVQSCSGCLPTPVSCANKGMIASENWNGDTVELINYGNMYQMKLNSKQPQGNTYYLTMTRTENNSFHLCLTPNSNQQSTMFEIFPYISSNNNGSNLYQIGTPTTGSLLGEAEPSCLVQNGVAIQSGYNMSVNAPRGMDDRSFFLLLPA
jgi:hypothetical protein